MGAVTAGPIIDTSSNK